VTWRLLNVSEAVQAVQLATAKPAVQTSRVFSSVQVRTPLAPIAQSRGVVVDASDMVSRKKARAELRKGRRAEKKSENGELASTPGAAALKRKTIASKAKNSKSKKGLASQVWHLLAVLCQVRLQ
jgi:hypothetical protein